LPPTEQVQDIQRLGVTGREQRMPAIFLWPWHYLATNNRSYRLLVALILEGGQCFGQPDLFWRCAHVRARFLIGDEQSAGQRFPAADSMRVAASPQGHVQVGMFLGQIQQGTPARVRLTGPRVAQRMQVIRVPELTSRAPEKR